MIKREVYYFEDYGEQNTEQTIEVARKAALSLGLNYIVVATASGATGVKAAEAFKGTDMKVVVVTEYAGMAEFKEELSSQAHILSSLQLNRYQSSTLATAARTP